MFVLKIVLAAFMMLAGVMHFVAPAFYERIVPRVLPYKRLIVFVSGLFELALGAGLLFAQTQHLAAWGLIALFAAIFPANVSQAQRKLPFGNLPLWVTWLRLPLQAGLIAWAYVFT